MGLLPGFQLLVGLLLVGQLLVGQLLVGQLPVGQLLVGQLLVGQLLVGQLLVGQLLVGQLLHSLCPRHLAQPVPVLAQQRWIPWQHRRRLHSIRHRPWTCLLYLRPSVG